MNFTVRFISKLRIVPRLTRQIGVRSYATEAGLSSFCSRTHTCGDLRLNHVGQEVTLCGWVQYQRLNMFLTLRDSYGVTQVLLPPTKEGAPDFSSETVIRVKGTVQARPDGQNNRNHPTGEIEVNATEFEVLNECQRDLPFRVQEHHRVNEVLRMEHRYLDLRGQLLQQNLRMRSAFLNRIRNFLCNEHGFVDVETPTLFRKTPGGAREFVVPTHHPGKFYTLPQSPQQFKQLLMVGGMDRYMQIARCYRDETARPDRQPEFTQIDMELSFCTAADIQNLTEQALVAAWPPEETMQPQAPFDRMTYHEAMQDYGSDKPDIRFGMKLQDVSPLFEKSDFLAFYEAANEHPQKCVKAMNFKLAGKEMSKTDIKILKAQGRQIAPDVWSSAVPINEDGTWSTSSELTKHMSPEIKDEMNQVLGLEPGDLLWIAAGTNVDACKVVGRMRVETANFMEEKGHKIRDDSLKFLWIEDFPLLLPKEEEGEGLESAHHPFTAPHPDDEELVYIDPEKARSQHFDLVLNGNEVGGGSIRIHHSKLQRYILDTVLKVDSSPLEHLIKALDYGCPPHGGIALGADRLMAMLCKTQTIKDVIAFPKSIDGKDPMSKAPALIDFNDRLYYHLTAAHKEKS